MYMAHSALQAWLNLIYCEKVMWHYNIACIPLETSFLIGVFEFPRLGLPLRYKNYEAHPISNQDKIGAEGKNS